MDMFISMPLMSIIVSVTESVVSNLKFNKDKVSDALFLNLGFLLFLINFKVALTVSI